MNNKTILLTIITLLTISTVSAAQITPQNPDGHTIEPGEEFTQEFDISFEENDSEIRVTASDTGEYDVGYNSFRIFNNDGTFSADVQAPNDISNYTYNVEFTFQVTGVNGSSKQVTRSVETFTKIPYTTLQEPVWINQSKQLEFNGDKYNVSEIGDNLYLNNNSVRVPYQDTTTVNDVRLELHDIIPGEYAKISADTQAENIDFQINQLKIQKDTEPEKCVLGVRTITTLQRGRSFAIETIDSETEDNEVVGGVSVTLINSGTGEPIGNEESGASGYVSFFIPEDVKGPVIARLAQPNGECDSTNQQLSFNTPYNNYIQNNEDFQLNLKPGNTTVYTDISGEVNTKSGEKVETGLIAITRPDGTSTDIAFNKTGFNFKPEQAGTYTIQATKQNYVSSDEIQIEYVPDQDGDDVPNSEDRCETVEGVPENDGCPPIEAEIRAYNTGEEYNILRPKTEYTFRIHDDNGSVVEYTGNATVEGQELRFVKGVSRHENGTTLAFPEQGSYTIKVDDPMFDNLQETLTVEKEAMFNDVPVAPILGIIALILVGGVIYTRYEGSSSSSRRSSTSSKKKFSPDHDFLDQGDEEVSE